MPWRPRRITHILGVAIISVFSTAANAETISLYAAGSLKSALGDVANAFEKATGVEIDRAFGPSGLMRGRIEEGEAAHVFASANMAHPQRLEAAGRGGPVALFARNTLCALAQDNVAVTTENLLDALLDPAIRVGTSTPKADPAGDYAFALFDKAEVLSPGATEKLKAKALQLTGGPDSAKAPEGQNPYAWVMEKGEADIFLTYCTNAVLAKRHKPDLQIVAISDALAVGADYGIIVLDDAPLEAWRFALFVLSPSGQDILRDYGFKADAVPAK